jgi:carboxymethylenebutenolidase
VSTAREERIAAGDGHEFAGHLEIPEAGAGPGLVVLQEIFGVTDYIRAACSRLAALGYVALAPDLYSRIEPRIDYDEREPDSLGKAFAAMQRLDVPRAADDAIATLAHLRELAEVRGRGAGVIGFCLGGGLAYFVAARAEPDVAVCYYGSAIPGALDLASSVHCPILFHFGEADEYITAEQREAVRVAFAGRPNAELHLHPGANHAFDNHNAAMFHHAEAAARAWEQTIAFLRRELPV